MVDVGSFSSQACFSLWEESGPSRPGGPLRVPRRESRARDTGRGGAGTMVCGDAWPARARAGARRPAPRRANKRKMSSIFGRASTEPSTSRGKAVGTWNTQRVGFAARSVLWDASASSRAKRAARWRPNAAHVVEVTETESARADAMAWKPWYTRFDAEQFAAELHAKRKLRQTSNARACID